MNIPLLTSISAILFAQFIKYPIALCTKSKKTSLGVVLTTGGMPSSHSAAVSSLIASLVLEYGFDSPYVAIATVFGVIIMFDSMGVRRQSGEQGLVLDLLARHQLKHADLEAEFKTLRLTHDIEDYENMIIDKYLGHKPTEVIAGVIVGCLVAFICRIILLSIY